MCARASDVRASVRVASLLPCPASCASWVAGQVVCVLGWRAGAGMGQLLQALEDRLPQGSNCHILSTRSIAGRNEDLEVRTIVG